MKYEYFRNCIDLFALQNCFSRISNFCVTEFIMKNTTSISVPISLVTLFRERYGLSPSMFVRKCFEAAVVNDKFCTSVLLGGFAHEE